MLCNGWNRFFARPFARTFPEICTSIFSDFEYELKGRVRMNSYEYLSLRKIRMASKCTKEALNGLRSTKSLFVKKFAQQNFCFIMKSKEWCKATGFFKDLPEWPKMGKKWANFHGTSLSGFFVFLVKIQIVRKSNLDHPKWIKSESKGSIIW